MSKYRALLLIILSAALACAMKNESLSLINESELVKNLRINKNKFEHQLLDNTWETEDIGYNLNMKLSKFWWDDFKPINFLRSCYYKFHHQMTIIKFKLSPSLLNTYQNAQINGYSALSAAILARDISPQVKRNFIQQLVNLNFKPTINDIELAELYLYDSHKITEYKSVLLDLLQDNPNLNWFMLPHDIKEQIVSYLIQLFRKDAWLLPEKSEQKEEAINYCIRAGIVEII